MDYSKSFITQILNEVKTIALVGASSKQERDSFKVMKSLLENGYEVFPVNRNEAGNLMLEQICYKDLSAIEKNIDMEDVIRAEDAIMEVTKESIEIKAKVLWTQLGLVNEDAAKLAEKAGLKVVMDRCPKKELESQIRLRKKNSF